MSRDDFDQQVARVAALGEPIRRELYRYVVAQAEPVSRDQAAAGVGVPRHVAKFHLDKLEEDGLLDVEYRRPPGRSGPGAGRPAKLYRRSARQIAVSLPERRYDLAGHILADAISAAEQAGLPVDGLVADAARAAGRALAHDSAAATAPTTARTTAPTTAPNTAPTTASPAERLQAIAAALAANGYEPRIADGRITLLNCPFHELAESHRALMCSVNLELIGGLLDGRPETGLGAALEPAPGRCCVTVRPSDP